MKTKIEKSMNKSVTYRRNDGLIVSTYFDRERYGADKYSFVILVENKLDDVRSSFIKVKEMEHVNFSTMCMVVNNFRLEV